jgi:DNA-directed RNA polymerase specialized sigma subunit
MPLLLLLIVAARDSNMTVRDIGAALGISHQRAQQLISS